MLSILIPTLNNRAAILHKLQDELLRQINKLPKKLQKVEIITCPDNGELSVGNKRQQLLLSSNKEYVVFIDDDDWIAEDYLISILTALETQPDCIGFKGTIVTNGQTHEQWEISHRHRVWSKSKKGYLRHTNHLTPVRREIALKAGFTDKRHAEDHDYSMALVPLIKTEVFIDKQLYIYKYQSKK